MDEGGGGCAGDVGGEVVEGEFWAGGEDDHVFEGVFEFADVSGPVVGDEGVFGVGVDAIDFFAELLEGAGEDVVDEEGDVVAAVAERGEFDDSAFDAEVEVFAEGAVADGGFEEVFIGGGDEADIDLDGLVGA